MGHAIALPRLRVEPCLCTPYHGNQQFGMSLSLCQQLGTWLRQASTRRLHPRGGEEDRVLSSDNTSIDRSVGEIPSPLPIRGATSNDQ